LRGEWMTRAFKISEEIEIPENIQVNIENLKVKISGPKGSLQRDFSHARNIYIRKIDGKILIETYFPRKREKAMVGTIKGHIKNMIKGVTEGFRYKLKIVYSHFPINIKVHGKTILIENFIGEKVARKARILGDVKIKVEGDDVIVEGIDIEAVSQTAANIENATKIKGKDTRVFLDGIYIYSRE